MYKKSDFPNNKTDTKKFKYRKIWFRKLINVYIVQNIVSYNENMIL